MRYLFRKKLCHAHIFIENDERTAFGYLQALKYLLPFHFSIIENNFLEFSELIENHMNSFEINQLLRK